MKIGVLSDTHGDVPATRRALDVFRERGVDLFIHCGDVGTEIVSLFRGMTAHFVCGNIDDAESLRAAFREPAHTLHEPVGVLDIEGVRIAFLHGDDVKLLRHTIHSGHCDVVCHGHTHTYAKTQLDGTLVLNPGAVSRTTQPSIAVIEIPSMEVQQLIP